MSHSGSGDVTALLHRWRAGDKAALDALIPLVYQELRRVARARLRAETSPQTLQTTALVHEVYLRLVDVDRLTFENRAHFMAVAARLMRQILVDHARRRRADKRGGGAALLSLDGVPTAVTTNVVDVLALDAALDDLARLEERLCRVVELKFFAGLTIDETASVLEVSPATIERDWSIAKAWLYDRLSS
jgi:RNA polymerase sigma factor (TIGR02999 family)